MIAVGLQDRISAHVLCLAYLHATKACSKVNSHIYLDSIVLWIVLLTADSYADICLEMN